jgi:hypothetical protein
MATLVEKITAADVRPKVVDACVALVEEEVASKGGLGGMAVKTGYKVIQAIKPGMIRESLDKLLPDFATALQPLYEASGASDANGDAARDRFVEHLESNRSEAADALLSVTDGKAENAKNRTLKKTYERLRPTAREHVEKAVPNLGRKLGGFL